MLTAQRPQPTRDASRATLPGGRMNRWLGLGLGLLALVAVFIAIALFQWRQSPAIASACNGGLFTHAQQNALAAAGVQVDTTYYQTGAPQVPTSGETALNTSEAQSDTGSAPARCLYEQLIRVWGGQDVFPTFNDRPTSNSPAWMVILQGTRPTVNAPGSPKDDTAYFIDPFSGNLMGSVNLPPESEASAF